MIDMFGIFDELKLSEGMEREIAEMYGEMEVSEEGDLKWKDIDDLCRVLSQDEAYAELLETTMRHVIAFSVDDVLTSLAGKGVLELRHDSEGAGDEKDDKKIQDVGPGRESWSAPGDLSLVSRYDFANDDEREDADLASTTGGAGITQGLALPKRVIREIRKAANCPEGITWRTVAHILSRTVGMKFSDVEAHQYAVRAVCAEIMAREAFADIFLVHSQRTSDVMASDITGGIESA